MSSKSPFANPFEFDFQKMVADLKVPGVDVDALVSSQKKNIDALTQANKVAFEGVQALIKRQTEIVKQAVEEAGVAASKVKDAATPAAKLSTQAELTKEAFERALANAKELADLVSKSNSEVIGLLNTRFTQSIDEFKTLVGKSANALQEAATTMQAQAEEAAAKTEAVIAEVIPPAPKAAPKSRAKPATTAE